MDVNRVNLGNYMVGNKNAGAGKKQEDQEEVKQNGVKSNLEQADAEAVMDALNYVGVQNLAFLSKNDNKVENMLADDEFSTDGVVDVEKYLDEDRIKDIEKAVTGQFEVGVSQIADVLAEEFPDMLADDERYALAAKIYAQE